MIDEWFQSSKCRVFGLLVGQKKQLVDVTFGSGKLG